MSSGYHCIENNSSDAVNKFRYMGNMIDNEESINMTIHDWVQIGNRVYYLTVDYWEANSLVVIQNKNI